MNLLSYRRAPVALACLAFLATACDMGLQKRLDEKKEQRFKKAAESLRAIEAERLRKLDESLPGPEAQPVGREHPMLQWRAQVAELKDGEALAKLSEAYRGTPTEDAASAGKAFVDAATLYWSGKGNLARHAKFLPGYLADAAKDAAKAEKLAKEKGEELWEVFEPRPFQREAAFDEIFLHAARFYKLELLPPEARLATAFPYWQIAFDEPSRGRESISDYVTRLCRTEKLAAVCKGVPHEVRPAAINIPYLKWAKERTEAFIKSNDVPVFDKVAEAFVASLTEAMKETPDLSENPVLPSTFSNRAASSGLTLFISPDRGIWLHNLQIAETFDGTIPDELASQAGEKLAELQEQRTLDYERVIIEAPGTLTSRQILKIIRAFPRNIVRQFDLTGRRRVDDSLRRTGILVRVPAEDESATTSYQLKSDAEKRSCEYLGWTGKPPIGRKTPGSYLLVDKKVMRAVLLSRDAETRELIPGEQTLAAPATDKEQLAKWANDNEGIVRLFFSNDMGYDEVMQLVTWILFSCNETEIALDERGTKTLKIPCGESKDRDITLVLGMCSESFPAL